MKKPKTNNKSTKIEKDCENCVEYLNGWKRAQADYQNLVKESEERRKDYVQYANANMIIELLPILDNFKSAFSQIPDNEKDSPWVIGFGYIKKQLEDFLGQNGVEVIKTVGENFDLSLHEAVENNANTQNIASPESEINKADEGVIIKEVRAGYTLNKKVIQVAKVIVQSSNNEKEQAE